MKLEKCYEKCYVFYSTLSENYFNTADSLNENYFRIIVNFQFEQYFHSNSGQFYSQMILKYMS